MKAIRLIAEGVLPFLFIGALLFAVVPFIVAFNWWVSFWGLK